MFIARAQYDPSSSPPSSPSPYVDSSPASSPSMDPIVLDAPPSFNLGHPFAASVKANRSPPQYEKKHSPSSTHFTSKRSASRPKYAKLVHKFEDDEYTNQNAVVPHTPRTSVVDRGASIWDEAITKVVDSGNGTMTLT